MLKTDGPCFQKICLKYAQFIKTTNSIHPNFRPRNFEANRAEGSLVIFTVSSRETVKTIIRVSSHLNLKVEKKF